MKAFKVFYSSRGKTTNDIVLVEDGMSIEEAIEKKDRDFRVGETYCKSSHYEIPLSNVRIRDLSITEFLMISE